MASSGTGNILLSPVCRRVSIGLSGSRASADARRIRVPFLPADPAGLSEDETVLTVGSELDRVGRESGASLVPAVPDEGNDGGPNPGACSYAGGNPLRPALGVRLDDVESAGTALEGIVCLNQSWPFMPRRTAFCFCFCFFCLEFEKNPPNLSFWRASRSW